MPSAAEAAKTRATLRKRDPVAHAEGKVRRNAWLRVLGAPKPDEHQIQKAFIDWVHAMEGLQPILRYSFAIPNGGGRNKGQAGRLKAEGVRAGVSDWMLPIDNREGYKGLLIEFKRESLKSQLTDEQALYLAGMTLQGWACFVCRSTEYAILVVSAYCKHQAKIHVDAFPEKCPVDSERIMREILLLSNWR